MNPTMKLRQVQRGYRNIDQGDRQIIVPNVVLQQWWEKPLGKKTIPEVVAGSGGEWRDIPVEDES